VLSRSTAGDEGTSSKERRDSDADSGHVTFHPSGVQDGLVSSWVAVAVMKDGQTVTTLHYKTHYGISRSVKAYLD
jgi:hypothetical protein